MDQTKYKHLTFDLRANGVLLVTIGLPPGLKGANRILHWELGAVWRDVAEDPDVRVAVITGKDGAFMPAGDLDKISADAGNYREIAGLGREALDIVHNIIDCDKPIVSAINGTAIGGGLAVALLADISIAGEDVTLSDGHVPLGMPAGDHAAIIWPLLCGMAKAKYYALTGGGLNGREAERIGLVSKVMPVDEVLETALEIADSLATGPQHAVRWTKRSLNHWLRTATPIFEASLFAEIYAIMGPDHLEALNAMKEERTPRFATDVSW